MAEREGLLATRVATALRLLSNTIFHLGDSSIPSCHKKSPCKWAFFMAARSERISNLRDGLLADNTAQNQLHRQSFYTKIGYIAAWDNRLI